jgi:hypothetical protein
MWALAILPSAVAQGPGRQQPPCNRDGNAARPGVPMHDCKARRRFRASFNGPVSVIFLLGEFTWQILTWRLRLPLLPKFLGTSTGVPNRSHGSAATACHIRFAVDFAQRGRQYFAREMFPVVGTLI